MCILLDHQVLLYVTAKLYALSNLLTVCFSWRDCIHDNRAPLHLRLLWLSLAHSPRVAPPPGRHGCRETPSERVFRRVHGAHSAGCAQCVRSCCFPPSLFTSSWLPLQVVHVHCHRDVSPDLGVTLPSSLTRDADMRNGRRGILVRPTTLHLFSSCRLTIFILACSTGTSCSSGKVAGLIFYETFSYLWTSQVIGNVALATMAGGPFGSASEYSLLSRLAIGYDADGALSGWYYFGPREQGNMVR